MRHFRQTVLALTVFKAGFEIVFDPHGVEFSDPFVGERGPSRGK